MNSIKAAAYRIRAVLFDFDGTLTRPGALDFRRIKQALSCPVDTPVLEYLQTIDDRARRRSAWQQLDQFELEGARNSRPNPGAQQLVPWIKSRGVSVAIITRNSLASVLRALENFDGVGPETFDLIITRDSDVAPKPSGDGIVWAARQLGIECNEILVVGDYLFDSQAGLAAGALTALLDPDNDPRLAQTASHFRIDSLDDLKTIVRAGIPLAPGKLPNDLLEPYLDELRVGDPSILVHPGVGEDVAAVRMGQEQVVVLKSDPITFACDALGQYAVSVNANDIATSGAIPRWFLATLLFPPGTSPSQVRQVMAELGLACSRLKISLCGGHTEITDAVQRPVVIGMMVGTVRQRDLIEKKNMRQGDTVLMTKQVAVEGVTIIARDFHQLLADRGISVAEIEAAKKMLDSISILPEARLASRREGVSAMHDVTEGGLATALTELSTAGGCKIAVDMEMISIPELTRRICSAVGIDPLGLIGSGALLICCRPEHAGRLCETIRSQGIAAAPIGRVLNAGRGVEACENGRPAVWPTFQVDEITKLYT
jgi:hydrogenase maturation factor/phosphoglycolate phosphatase-like HAD superfamily hydrolase